MQSATTHLHFDTPETYVSCYTVQPFSQGQTLLEAMTSEAAAAACRIGGSRAKLLSFTDRLWLHTLAAQESVDMPRISSGFSPPCENTVVSSVHVKTLCRQVTSAEHLKG